MAINVPLWALMGISPACPPHHPHWPSLLHPAQQAGQGIPDARQREPRPKRQAEFACCETPFSMALPESSGQLQLPRSFSLLLAQVSTFKPGNY